MECLGPRREPARRDPAGAPLALTRARRVAQADERAGDEEQRADEQVARPRAARCTDTSCGASRSGARRSAVKPKTQAERHRRARSRRPRRITGSRTSAARGIERRGGATSGCACAHLARRVIGHFSSGKKHAASWPRAARVELRVARSRSTSRCARGQRGWKRQPLGGLIGFGTSPPRTNALRPRPTARVRDRAPPRGARRCTGAAAPRRGRVSVGQLGDLPEVHHGDPVGDVAHDAQVVRDEDVGQPELRLEVLEQVEDLRLHRDVERRDGLVGDDQLRVDGERAGDADPLALAARELVREPVVVLGVEPDHLEQVLDARFRSASVPSPWISSGSADDEPDPLAGIQRRVRVLEDHHQLAPERPHVAARRAA